MTIPQLSAQFLLQLGVILLACRVVGALARPLRQPPVVGEILAGVLLGPTVFGALWPDWHAAFFPAQSMPILHAVALAGISLYMFGVGCEFRGDVARHHARSALALSISGIAAPFVVGAGIALLLFNDGRMFGPGVAPMQAALFLGAAMSITAFPVVARIVQDRGLTRAPLGTLALASGLVNDAAAWVILALALAGFTGDLWAALIAVGGGALFAGVCWFLVRPLLKAWERRVAAAGPGAAPSLGAVLGLLLLACWFTERIGMHAVFGAFVFGLCVPRGAFAQGVANRVVPLASALLLPMFFVYSGLNTRITLVNTPELWLLAIGVLLAATLSKGFACGAAARLAGESPRTAVGIGALMNARGLMELILLNIGLERGILTPTLFAIMVIMTIVTTLMATPILDAVIRPAPRTRSGDE